MSEKFQPLNHTEEQSASENQNLDDLYNRLPDELRVHWENKLDGLTDEEQIDKLIDVLSKRADSRQSFESSNFIYPEGVDIYNHFPEDMTSRLEEIRNSEERIEVGYGQAGHVVASPSQASVCYKVLFDEEELPIGTNSIARETELQHILSDKLDGTHGVRVPQVYAFIREPGTSAISMELLNASSLRRIVEREAEALPENFDIDKFFSALESFVNEMHELNFHHRDLHFGNVLVDRETGMPCVIDFGLSTNAGFDPESASRVEYHQDGQVKELVLLSDLENLKKLRQQVEKHIKGK